MSLGQSHHNQINHELVRRRKNTRGKQAVKKLLHSDLKTSEALLRFKCECSAQHCQSHIAMPPAEYEALHQASTFVIAKGHEQPALEKIIADKGSFVVVEKYALQS